ncbi:hypothetical protein KEM48_009746 [Puccinia striiformis f. sp. tritici PST-130]|nr:hypothetical protein KEM48_009746 [Puccinia striiformis f. sp. tritici PST-130]
MGPEDFNPRGSRVFKKDLVQFLKEIDSSIHLPSSISKKGLIQLVEKRLGRASVAPATSRILRQRSNSPVLEITPSTVSTSPSDVGMTSIPAADPQSGKPPSIKPRKSPSIEQVKQTSVITSNLVATSPTPQPSNNTTAAITRMNVGRQWCYLEPKDPNVEPTISRLQTTDIRKLIDNHVFPISVQATPESAVAVGSIYYWDPKDNTKHSIFSDCSRPNLLSECTEKVDQWSIIDASDAASEPDNSPSPIITNHTPENIVEIHNELTVPGAFPIQIDSLIYPPSHSFTEVTSATNYLSDRFQDVVLMVCNLSKQIFVLGK